MTTKSFVSRSKIIQTNKYDLGQGKNGSLYNPAILSVVTFCVETLLKQIVENVLPGLKLSERSRKKRRLLLLIILFYQYVSIPQPHFYLPFPRTPVVPFTGTCLYFA